MKECCNWTRKTQNVGLRMGDVMLIRPIQGHTKKVFLNFTQYEITESGSYSASVFGTELKLSSMPNETFCYFIKQVEIDGLTTFIISSKCGRPFCLNGSEVFKAILCRGDSVRIGENKIEFFDAAEFEMNNEMTLVSDTVAKSQLIVYLEGETGTGKTHLARQIHKQSGRFGNFVHLNLSALGSGVIESELFGHVKGAFTGAVKNKMGAIEEANHGTLFLDEIDSISESLQLKLLLFLDNYHYRQVGGCGERCADIRIIFASGRKLEDLVKDGKIRKDFFYRVTSGVSLHLKPLRNNPQMINYLISKFEFEHKVKFDPNLIQFYLKQSWPGNIRQLLGHLDKKRVLTRGSYIEWDDSDKILEKNYNKIEVKDILSFKDMKFQYFLDVYNRLSRNLTQTARALQVTPMTVRHVLDSVLSQPVKIE